MLRIAMETDIPAMLEIYRPYVENTTVSFEYAVPTREEFLERFRTVTAQFPWLVWEEAGKILGYAYAARPFARQAYWWCAEPSIYLESTAQGQGIGRRMYLALEQILKQQGYFVLYAWVTGENLGSVAFHRRMGYKIAMQLEKCGYKMGRWCDLIWMEKRLICAENPVEFPTSWGTIMQDDEKIRDISYKLSIS